MLYQMAKWVLMFFGMLFLMLSGMYIEKHNKFDYPFLLFYFSGLVPLILSELM